MAAARLALAASRRLAYSASADWGGGAAAEIWK